MKNKTMFMLLSRHTDWELTCFLQDMAQKGWWLKSCKGNKFTFVPKEFDGTRLCAYTFFSRGSQTPTENQVRHELVSLRNDGWDTICVGPVEDIADSKRHIFLYEEIPGSTMPAIEPEQEKRAKARGLRKKISNSILCLAYLVGLVVLLNSDLVKLSTSNVYVIFSLLFFALLLVCLTCCILSFTKKGSRFLDLSTRLIFYCLCVFALFLSWDVIWLDNSSKGVETQISGEKVKIYSDDSPLTLETLDLNTEGQLRSTRYTASSSFLASYEHFYDQSFGSSQSQWVSATVYYSGNLWLLKLIEKQIAGFVTVKDPDMSSLVGHEVCLDSQRHKAVISLPNSLCVLTLASEITKEQIVSVNSLLVSHNQRVK